MNAPDKPLAGKRVAFTGRLASLTRSEAAGLVRKHGGALFGDYRYGHVFFYHNGADSYYAARGFRGELRV